MEWIELKEASELAKIKELSALHPVLIFKHSTRCSISSSAISRLERNWNKDEMKNVTTYYLDLINYRDLSNKIASDFQIEHQSPQLLLIQNGQCKYDASHMEISYSDIKELLHP